MKKFLEWLPKSVYSARRGDIRLYLKDRNLHDYTRKLKALKLFFRDFLEMPHVVQTFKFKREPFKPKQILTKEQLQRFYHCLDLPIERALFLIYATTGLRKNEILSLKMDDIDFSKRMVMPNCHKGSTKHSYVSFYNEETEVVLQKIKHEGTTIFSISDRAYRKIWRKGKHRTGLAITAQRLREWFCSEMALKGVSDSYIDAFCGRTPRSVLARHYLNYSPEKLKQIYDKADLKVLV